jgi:glutamate-1-semialdehyde 2,1-aminomutase
VKTFDHSRELHERAVKVTPGGAQTASKAPGRVGPLGAFPLYLAHGDGAYVTDVDGHEYVDWFNGNCAVTLGHGHRGVTLAASEAAKRGALLSLPTQLEAVVAEQLVQVIPCAEQVRFLKTGSEACAAAVRIARMATGGTRIAVCEGQYHGWHDWSIARNAYRPGIPDELHDLLLMFPYNDIEWLRRTLQDEDVAAVMLEPTLVEPPVAGFLEGVVELAHANGALVIFDEMITGARWALGGAQQYFGVTPDLATFGKGYANGFPLAFVAGPETLMQHAWPISGTFSGETVSLAACDATLREYRSNRAIPHLWDVGHRLMDGVNGILAQLQLPARMIGYPCRPVLRWDAGELYRGPMVADNLDELAELNAICIAIFQQELAQQGVLAHPSGWNPSAAHDGVALEKTLAGVDRALTSVAAAAASGNPRAFLHGELIKPAFARQALSA